MIWLSHWLVLQFQEIVQCNDSFFFRKVPTEKLLSAFERVLVNTVNIVGVDINRAVNDPYYAALLSFVSGLGPRKAQALTKKVVSLVSFF